MINSHVVQRSNEDSTSLNKYISATGMCSRREAEKFIKEGRVTINGKVAVLGNRVFSGDDVKLDGEKIGQKKRPIYIAFNKPVGIVCTTDQSEPKNIIRFINHHERLFPIGRLDKPSEGLIFLTNDGDIVNKILRAGNNHQKEYVVTVKQPIKNSFIVRMGKGVPIMGTVTKKCKVTQIDNYTFNIILTQGLNRQIRRMCEYLGYDVKTLKRIRVMNVTLGGLKTGQTRNLTRNEMKEIELMIANSSKTEEASLDIKKINFKTKRKPEKGGYSKRVLKSGKRPEVKEKGNFDKRKRR